MIVILTTIIIITTIVIITITIITIIIITIIIITIIIITIIAITITITIITITIIITIITGSSFRAWKSAIGRGLHTRVAGRWACLLYYHNICMQQNYIYIYMYAYVYTFIYIYIYILYIYRWYNSCFMWKFMFGCRQAATSRASRPGACAAGEVFLCKSLQGPGPAPASLLLHVYCKTSRSQGPKGISRGAFHLDPVRVSTGTDVPSFLKAYVLKTQTLKTLKGKPRNTEPLEP